MFYSMQEKVLTQLAEDNSAPDVQKLAKNLIKGCSFLIQIENFSAVQH